MKTKQLILIANLLLAMILNTAFAETANKPSACPSVAAIQAASVEQTRHYGAGNFNVYHTGNYGTEQLWAFIIGIGPSANSPEEALSLGRKALTTLSALQPEPVDIGKMWACEYGIEGFYIALAFPISDPADIPIFD